MPEQTVHGGGAVTNKSGLPYNNFSIDLWTREAKARREICNKRSCK